MHRILGTSVTVLLCLFALLCASAAAGAVIHVPGDQLTIQAGVDAAADGDTVLIAAGTFTGAGNVDVNLSTRGLSVIGAGPDQTTINGGGSARAFFAYMADLTTCRIQGLKMTNCASTSDGGAIWFTNGQPVLHDLVINNAYCGNNGGGLFFSGGSPVLTAVTVENCYAPNDGGGIFADECVAFVADVLTVSGSQAVRHGGGLVLSGVETPDLNQVAITTCTAASRAGGLYVIGGTPGNAADLQVRGCASTGGYGGGLYVHEGGLNVTGGVFWDNTALTAGGGIYVNTLADVDLIRVDVVMNTPGGLYSGGTTGTHILIEDSIIAFNEGNKEGLYGHYTTDIQVTCTDIYGNTNGDIGGSMANPIGSGGNISEEPLFCDPGAGDLTVSDISPCLPGYNTCGVQMGCYGEGCTTPSNIYYVPGDYATIQAAVDACGHGDKVLIAAGVYTGPGNTAIDFGEKSVSLIGVDGSESTIIDCEGAGRGLLIQRNTGTLTCELRGITIRNAVAAGSGGGIYMSRVLATLTDIRLENCWASNEGGGLWINGADNSTLTDLSIEGCSANNESGAMALKWSDNVAITDLLIRDNDSQDNECVRIYQSDVAIARLTLTDNVSPAIHALSSNVLLENSIFAFNGGDQATIVEGANSAVAVYCCADFGNTGGTYGGTMSDPVGSDGNISANPLFCDGAAQDYHLAANSPCLPENNVCGVRMGAFGEGCDAVQTYTITGYVRDGLGANMEGVAIQGGPYALTTGLNGRFQFVVTEGWSGTLTPVKGFWDFSPSAIEITDVQSHMIDQDFTGARRAHCFIPDEFASLNAAVPLAENGDSILFRAGTYIDTNPYYVDFDDKTLSVIGLSGPEETILDCGTGYKLRIEGGQGADFLLQGLTLTGNWSAYEQAVTIVGSSPTIRDCRIVDNRNFSQPDESLCAGMYLSGGCASLIEDCVFSGNSSSDNPALSISGASPVLNNILFTDNEGVHGGCVRIYGGAPEFNDCVFSDNTAMRAWLDDSYLAPGTGGALYITGGAPEFTRCLFSGNEAQNDSPNIWDEYARSGYGGAVYAAGDCTPLFASCTFHGNRAGTWDGNLGGGHIRISEQAQVTLEQCLITDGLEGGGLKSVGDFDPVFTCCDVWNNADGDFINITDPTGTDGNISADPIYCGAETGDFTVAANSPCLPENNTCGLLIGAYGQGCTGTAVEETAVPAATYLAANHPNPFNPTTKIAFGLVEPSAVTLRVYDAAGRLIATLLDGAARDAGRHEAVWTGRDDAGAQASSGVYFYRLEAGAFSETRKMTLLK